MSGYGGWETLDVAALLGLDEAGPAGTTTTANVGPYQVPLGPVLRRSIPSHGSQEDYLRDIPEAYRELLGLHKKRK